MSDAHTTLSEISKRFDKEDLAFLAQNPYFFLPSIIMNFFLIIFTVVLKNKIQIDLLIKKMILS